MTPYRLPYFSPARSLRVLLTPAERIAPWLLFFKPGLLAAQALYDLCTAGFLLPLRCVLVPAMSLPMREMRWGTISPVRAGLLAGVVLLSSLVLCPLEVIVLRLSVQCDSAASTAPHKPEKGGLDLYTPEQEVIRQVVVHHGVLLMFLTRAHDLFVFSSLTGSGAQISWTRLHITDSLTVPGVSLQKRGGTRCIVAGLLR